ncbi:MAG: efflux transporter outer membrane subunit [Deltaproteobacteria bacterium]|nr:efflux transporter outer membrane subunit [Deltaproteobacteria bacterium]
MRRRIFALQALAFSVGLGCALTPDYERPELGLPDAFVQPSDPGESIANLSWFDTFRDPVLRDHIETALAENQDLGVAAARISEARELVTFVRANQFPFLDLFGGAGRGRRSQILLPGASTSDNFSISGDLSFEVDLWRKLSRATEASRADLLATEAAYRGVTIRLVSDVASTYLLLRDVDARLAIAERTVSGRTDSLTIIQARFEKGTVPELDVNQAQVELAIAEVATASFERQVVQTENALRVLLGRYPGAIDRGRPLEEAPLDAAIPAGLPSELLQRRPDLVAAEQQLAAETARIGVAEAQRWPSISLTGSLGAISDELSSLNSSEAKAWNLTAGLFAPVFHAGQLKAQAKAQHARAEQALRTYEGSLRQAFREVEDALIAVRSLRTEHDARGRQVRAARNAARLSRARYDGGVVDFLEVLESERSLFTAELDESATRQGVLTALVSLYQALGGGWTPPPPVSP